MSAARPETEETLRADALAIARELHDLARKVKALDRRVGRYQKAHPLAADDPRLFTFADWLKSDTEPAAKIHLIVREFAATAHTTDADLVELRRKGEGRSTKPQARTRRCAEVTA